MAGSVILFLLLTLPSTLNDAHNLATADDTLIEQQCHNAEVPATCIQCLKSDPKAQEATDKIGIASVIVSCLSNHAKALAANMSDLVSQASDGNLKSAYKECSRGYFHANKELSKVFSALKNGEYDNANHCVRMALEFQLTCQKSIHTHEKQIPADIVYVMRVYQQLSEAEMRIIDRF